MNSYLKKSILNKVLRIREMHHLGLLGGHLMPEDFNPGLNASSIENTLFFTLPMSLNYQRNSYALWPEATKAFIDVETKSAFVPSEVCDMSDDDLRLLLTKYKVALQPNKHIQIWKRLCHSIVRYGNGDVRNIIASNGFSVSRLKQFMQIDHKGEFPYLCGPKIFNYWLYVLEQYADVQFIDREMISIAPDTHIIQASILLGVIDKTEVTLANVREIVAQRWTNILQGTNLSPIDIHTPLWLWSRSNFPQLI